MKAHHTAVGNKVMRLSEHVAVLRPNDEIPHFHETDYVDISPPPDGWDYRTEFRTRCGLVISADGRKSAFTSYDPDGRILGIHDAKWVESTLRWGTIELPLRHARAFAEPCKRCFPGGR